MEKYSREMFEGFTHRFNVGFRVDNDYRNNVYINIYSNSDSFYKISDFIYEKKTAKVVGFYIEHRASKEDDEMATEFINEVLAGI